MADPGPGSADRPGLAPPDGYTFASHLSAEDGERAFLEMLVGNISEGILAIDESSTVVFANQAVHDIFGYPPTEVVGEPLTALMPDRLVGRHRDGFEHYLETGERSLDWEHVELPGQHRDGHEVDLGISFRETDQGDERLFVGIVRDITKRNQREWKLERYDAIVSTVENGVYQLDADGTIVTVNDVVVDTTGYSRAELLGEHVTRIVDEASFEEATEKLRELRGTDRQVATVNVDIQTADGDRIPAETNLAPLESDGEIRGAVGVARDVTERKRRERQLRRVSRLNELVRKVVEATVEAETRNDIEATVCDRLAAEEAFVGAAIGDVNVAREHVQARTTSGVDPALIDVPVGPDSTPAGRAAATRAPHVLQCLDDADVDASWRSRAENAGVGSVAAVPIQYEERFFGVLAIYARDPEMFGEREATVLGDLGRSIGHAVTAIERRAALLSDDVLELEFVHEELAELFRSVTPDTEFELSINRVVPSEDETFQFISATGISSDELVEVLEDVPHLSEVEPVADERETCRVRVTAPYRTMSEILADNGGRVRTARFTDGEFRIVAEVPVGTDVRQVAEAVRDVYPEMDLRSQRTTHQRTHTIQEFRAAIEDELTDRQRTALEIAYHSGFFDWPRESTGEDVADAMGLSSATFNQHLRFGEQKLMRLVFDETF